MRWIAVTGLVLGVLALPWPATSQPPSDTRQRVLLAPAAPGQDPG
jgi:hypothetical protein